VTFHRYGIAATGDQGNLKSLPVIIAELKHSDKVIDVFKIDVEGAEFGVFADVETLSVLKKHVRQILLEVHYKSEEQTKQLAKTFTAAGFYTFSKEPNIQARIYARCVSLTL